LEAEPAAEAATAGEAPAEFAGGADDAVLLALQDAGQNQGCAGPPVGFQAREQVKKEMVVEVGDDEIGRGNGVTQDIPDTKTDASAESVQFQVPVCLLHGHGIAVPSLDLCPKPGSRQGQDAGAAAKIQHPAGLEALAVLPHELDDVAEAETGGGVFPGAESGSGADLETGDSLKVLGKEAGVAGDDEVVADSEMERGRFALKKLADPTLEPGLELAKGKNLGGVDLENGRLTGAFELGGRQREFGGGQRAGFENVHI
jgi:hypothetical protein